MKRDPRKDPKFGDVLRRPGQKAERHVEMVGPMIKGGTDGVAWCVKGRVYRWVCMDLWRKWAQNAEVLKAVK